MNSSTRRLWRNASMLACLSLGSVMFSGRAFADEPLATQRLNDLSQMTQLLEGFTMRPDVWIGELAYDTDMSVAIDLAVGNEYVILLGADARGHGLFVEVIDAQNQVIARSEPSGAEVLCRVTPSATGSYEVHFVRPAPTSQADLHTIETPAVIPQERHPLSPTDAATLVSPSLTDDVPSTEAIAHPLADPTVVVVTFAARLAYR